MSVLDHETAQINPADVLGADGESLWTPVESRQTMSQAEIDELFDVTIEPTRPATSQAEIDELFGGPRQDTPNNDGSPRPVSVEQFLFQGSQLVDQLADGMVIESKNAFQLLGRVTSLGIAASGLGLISPGRLERTQIGLIERIRLANKEGLVQPPLTPRERLKLFFAQRRAINGLKIDRKS